MVKLIWLVGVLSLCGCATYAPYDYTERCALKGMLLDGVDTQSGSAFAVNNYGQVATAYGSGENLRCNMPKTDDQKMTVARELYIVEPKYSYNMGLLSSRNYGEGWYYQLVPGLAKYVWDKRKEKALKESDFRRNKPIPTLSIDSN